MGATLRKLALNTVVVVVVEAIATTATTKTWGHPVGVNVLCEETDYLYLSK